MPTQKTKEILTTLVNNGSEYVFRYTDRGETKHALGQLLAYDSKFVQVQGELGEVILAVSSIQKVHRRYPK